VVSLFSLTEIWPKNEIKNENFKKLHDFGDFQSPAVTKKIYIARFLYLVFKFVAKNIEG
jgi:hypothetical protein